MFKSVFITLTLRILGDNIKVLCKQRVTLSTSECVQSVLSRELGFGSELTCADTDLQSS